MNIPHKLDVGVLYLYYLPIIIIAIIKIKIFNKSPSTSVFSKTFFSLM